MPVPGRKPIIRKKISTVGRQKKSLKTTKSSLAANNKIARVVISKKAIERKNKQNFAAIENEIKKIKKNPNATPAQKNLALKILNKQLKVKKEQIKKS